MKLFYVFSIIKYSTIYGSSRARRLLDYNGAKLSLRFVLKSLVRESSMVVLFSIICVQIFLFTLILLIVEKDPQTYQLKSFSETLWLIMLMMTTVGFGDVAPETVLGRTICIAASLAGVGTISLIVMSMN